MSYVSSYDPNARVPKLGSRWVWEIDAPAARELIEVAEVIWNGEEWWVKTKSLLRNPTYPRHGDEFFNDLSRFWEAVAPVGGSRDSLSERRPAEVAAPA